MRDERKTNEVARTLGPKDEAAIDRELEHILEQSILTSMKSLLGESAANAIIYHLHLESIARNPHMFHESLYAVLKQPSMFLEEMIVKDFFGRLRIQPEQDKRFDFERSIKLAKRVFIARVRGDAPAGSAGNERH